MMNVTRARKRKGQAGAARVALLIAPVAALALWAVSPLSLLQLAQPLLKLLAFVFAAAAVLGIAYCCVASVMVRRFFAQPCHEPVQCPSVTVVKPLHGDEWNLISNLTTFFEQDYTGPVQYLFGVHDAGDAALQAVEALRARYPQAHITVVADSRLYGPNRKIANLVNMLERAEHDVLCFADSDVTVERSYLRHVVGALEQPGVGLVTCVYRGLCAPGFWPRAAAALTNYQFLPGVVTGLAIGLARPCFGQTIAMTRATLERIGGLVQFAHHLAEDHALGEAVRRTGASVAIPPFTVQHACVETTFAKLFTHELRWSRTIRAADRSGHLSSTLMHPFALALVAVLASGGAPAAAALALAALLARAALKWQTDRAIGERCRGLWLLPMWDIVQFMIFAASFWSSRVVWRGFSFSVDGNGLLSPLHDD
ncbi:bacteriohopanetetrol glucosamine biosynthesis glycosyltransferase HpnI [Paraburkholderia denitrificans]|uniref:Bacteriohopanetetrol glucosamine biosynthesis glycosyltransferase HpnI n=1 Tax=Paraburkholderia denitrificans TaxID=694025 RepID=A0ABW0JDK9_9BURK